MKITKRQLRKLIIETLGGDDPSVVIDKIIKIMSSDFEYGLVLAEDLKISHVDIRDRITVRVRAIYSRVRKTGRIPDELNDLTGVWDKLWELSRQGKHYTP